MSSQEVGEIFGTGTGPAHAMLRSPTVLIASVGLWGVNVYFFRLFGINYVRVLKHDLIKLEHEYDAVKKKDDGPNRSSAQLDEHSANQKFKRKADDDTNGSSTTANSNIHGNDVVEHRHGHHHHQSKQKAHKRLDSSSTSSKTPEMIQTSEKQSPSSTISLPDYSSEDDEFMDEYDDNLDASGIVMLSDSTDPSSAATGGYSKSNYRISWGRLVCFSLSLLFLLHSTYFVWLDVMGGTQLGAIFAFYGVVIVSIIFPLPSTRWLRKATVIVLQRAFELINPRCSCVSPDQVMGPRPIPFVDVFFADAMCSLSKVFFDWGFLLHMASHYPEPVPADAHNILVPSAFAAIPFLIRARQCLIMYNVCRIKADPSRFSHLWNALKYSTSIFPLCLSAYQKTVDHTRAKSLEPYLILLLAINALYALYWDIVMDWGMMQQPTAACAAGVYPMDQKRSCGHALMRPRLRFGVGMSALIVLADCILRFSWTLRFYTKLFPSGDSFVLCTQFLEVFRRALWNLLRVEWEQIKQIKSRQIMLPVAKGEEEMTTLLPTGKQASSGLHKMPSNKKMSA